jgi:hypothetical protein
MPIVTTSTQQGSSMSAPLSEASQIPLDRMIIRRMFPNTSKFNNTHVMTRTWATSPFRVYFNAGDLLNRQYEPGGPNQVKGSVGIGQYRNTLGGGDGVTKGNGASGNQHYVHDSSEYIKFKRLRAKLQNYNDISFGGSNNGAYTYILGIRH